MRRINSFLLAAALLLGIAAAARADEETPLPAWSTSLVSSAMCDGSKIHLVVTGTVAVAFDRACAVLLKPDILEKIEALYRRELPPGEPGKLEVTRLETNGHYRVRWKTDLADVRDVWRATDTTRFFEGGYVLTSERFFGSFETVLVVRVMRTPEDQASFRADILVYPHNGFIRFLFSTVLSVESHFRRTTAELSAEFQRICTSLCREESVPSGSRAQS